jgi:hypothetical protein
MVLSLFFTGGLTGTEGGAGVCHAARLSTETVEGEVATAGVQYVVVRLLPGDQDHVHGQSPGAGACLGQGPRHLSKIALPLPRHLQSVQVRIGPHLYRSVLKERRVWFPMEMAPPIPLASRGKAFTSSNLSAFHVSVGLLLQKLFSPAVLFSAVEMLHVFSGLTELVELSLGNHNLRIAHGSVYYAPTFFCGKFLLLVPIMVLLKLLNVVILLRYFILLTNICT